MASHDEATVESLQAFADAWNRHDVDALMEFMTHDCVFETSSGPDVCGTRYEGLQAVRKGFASVWESFPDAQWLGARPRHELMINRVRVRSASCANPLFHVVIGGSS